MDRLISEQAVIDVINEANRMGRFYCGKERTIEEIKAIPSTEPKTGHCKDCKYFEYDSVAKVDGIPLIVAHEICKRWGDGCKTKEDGYCFLYEPQESDYQRQVEQYQYDTLYEPTFDSETGSM